MIQIASMVQRQGETEPFIRTVFTLQSCASIVGSQILCFTQEKQLLQVYTLASVKHWKKTFWHDFLVPFSNVLSIICLVIVRLLTAL